MTAAALRAVLDGLNREPMRPLGPDAGPFDGMRPAVVVGLLLPLAALALAFWAKVLAVALGFELFRF